MACAALVLKAMPTSAFRERTTRSPTDKAREAFVTWCQSRSLNPMPANPWTVAAYGRFFEKELQPATIRKFISDLTRVHKQKTRKRLAHHPLVERTLDIIERGAEAYKNDGALFDDDDALDVCPPKRPRRKSAAKLKTDTRPKPMRTLLGGQPR